MADWQAVCVCGIDVSNQSNTRPSNMWTIYVLAAMVICSVADFGNWMLFVSRFFTHDLKTKRKGKLWFRPSFITAISAPQFLFGKTFRGHRNCLQIDAKNFTRCNGCSKNGAKNDQCGFWGPMAKTLHAQFPKVVGKMWQWFEMGIRWRWSGNIAVDQEHRKCGGVEIVFAKDAQLLNCDPI